MKGALAELGPNAHGYRADVTVAEDRKRLFADLGNDFGELDIVFANAGIGGRTPTGATDEATFENIVHTNLNGAFFTVNSAAPLLNDNGSIIFNGSVHNYLGQAGMAAYAATKGGLVSMARAIAADLAPHNIRVNVVAPGATKTPIWRPLVPLKTLLLNPPSFEKFDGGASSRWPATREIESYWYPVWLAYPAGLLEGSRLLDAPSHDVKETIQICKNYEFLVLFISTIGWERDQRLAVAIAAVNPSIRIAFVG